CRLQSPRLANSPERAYRILRSTSFQWARLLRILRCVPRRPSCRRRGLRGERRRRKIGTRWVRLRRVQTLEAEYPPWIPPPFRRAPRTVLPGVVQSRGPPAWPPQRRRNRRGLCRRGSECHDHDGPSRSTLRRAQLTDRDRRLRAPSPELRNLSPATHSILQ